jgi:hypothetical protein
MATTSRACILRASQTRRPENDAYLALPSRVA